MDEFVGKRVLVGLTYLDASGEIDERTEFWGEIVDKDDAAITIRRADNSEFFTLPPGLQVAEPGEYRLRSTGEVVVAPDFVAIFSIHPPSEGGCESSEGSE